MTSLNEKTFGGAGGWVSRKSESLKGGWGQLKYFFRRNFIANLTFDQGLQCIFVCLVNYCRTKPFAPETEALRKLGLIAGRSPWLQVTDTAGLNKVQL